MFVAYQAVLGVYDKPVSPVHSRGRGNCGNGV